MESTRRNPVPLPASGPLGTVQTQMDSTEEIEAKPPAGFLELLQQLLGQPPATGLSSN